MDFGHLFFKFDGRVNRAKYWLAALIYSIIYIVLFGVGLMAGQSLAFRAVDGLLGLVILISGIAVGIKRLHDRNKSGWYMLLFYLAPGILVAASIVTTGNEGSAILALAFVLAAIAIGVWAFIELGCLRGTIGGNRYGVDPIAPEILTPPVHTH